MIYRAKAPLRLGLAGGGTDVSPYSDIYGGYILNATINSYAYISIEPLNEDKIILQAWDQNILQTFDLTEELPLDGILSLHKGVYNRIVKDFSKKALACKISSFVDAPAGSGLGTSSTLTVALLGAFCEWLKLPLGEYDVAHLAYSIERIDLGMSGGKQDQYSATFGGFNFMEFYANDTVIVNPLRIKDEIINELSMTLVLIYTGTSRLSAKIIDEQTRNVKENRSQSLEAMHSLKEYAKLMKDSLLRGNYNEIGNILHKSWISKKDLAHNITDSHIDKLYEAGLAGGSTGGKVSGAGGGGYIMFYCPGNTRYQVIRNTMALGGTTKDFEFINSGMQTWSGGKIVVSC